MKTITMDLVIKGLKFIAEYPGINDRKMTDSLRKLGWSYSWRDLNEQFSFKERGRIYEGMKQGNLCAGASIIINVIEGRDNREYYTRHFLNVDDETSVYHFIRKVTGDKSYTKDRIDNEQL